MSELKWNQLIGQERIKDVLGAAFRNGTLGHAYLLCGDSGTGKFAAALDLAMALLCKGAEEKPCLECENCRRVLTCSHPDFHVVMPLSLSKEHKSSDGKLSDEGWKYLSQCVKVRIDDPYSLQEFSTMPSIPVEWIRELNHAINRGALEGGCNVVILDGVDSMNKEAANAMLKTLEEPPAGTVMILLTDKIHAVLPTIISRCQILRLPYLPPETIRSYMVNKLSVSPQDSRVEEVVGCGSLSKALYQFANPSEEISGDVDAFWNACASKNWQELFGLIDRLGKLEDFSAFEKFFIQLMHLIRNAFLGKIEGTENYIIGNRSKTVDLRGVATPDDVEMLVEICQRSVSQLHSRAQISLVLVNFATSVMEIFNGKK